MMPVDGIARMVGTLGFGASVVTTTTPSDGVLAAKPSTITDGLRLRLTSRLRLKTTSSAVTGLPSAKVASSRSRKVNSVASSFDSHDSARRPTGVVTSSPSKVVSVSYIACTTRLPVASYTCAGSRWLTTKDVLTVSVPPWPPVSSPPPVAPPPPPPPPAVQPAIVSAAATASAPATRTRRDAEPLMGSPSTSLEGEGGTVGWQQCIALLNKLTNTKHEGVRRAGGPTARPACRAGADAAPARRRDRPLRRAAVAAGERADRPEHRDAAAAGEGVRLRPRRPLPRAGRARGAPVAPRRAAAHAGAGGSAHLRAADLGARQLRDVARRAATR